MQPNHDLDTILAPHLDALSVASATILTPLTSVLTTLITELVALRTAHHQLQAQVSRIDARLPIVFPHSIPSPPNSLSPESPIIDPELTQPPSPFPLDIPHQNHPTRSISPNSQNQPSQQHTDEIRPASRTPSPDTSGVNSERLKRRRRSSKRPVSATSTPRTKDEKLEQPSEFLSSQEQGVCKIEKPLSSNGITSPNSKCDSPKKIYQTNRKPLKNCDKNLLVLPTTPTTEMKPKKRKSTEFSYEPVIEGYNNAADAAKDADKIVARREAENCPPSFRPQRKSLSERTCVTCQDTLRAQAANAPDPDVEFQRLLRSGCRHKEQVPRPATPEGYWALDFAETPTQPP